MQSCRYVIEPVAGLVKQWESLGRSTMGSLPAHREMDAGMMQDLAQARGMANRLAWPEEKGEP